jgi:tRNA(adenine34) deaminase
MTPDELVGLAIDVAEEGLIAGELPIGAVVVMGDVIVSHSHGKSK